MLKEMPNSNIYVSRWVQYEYSIVSRLLSPNKQSILGVHTSSMSGLSPQKMQCVLTYWPAGNAQD